MVSEFDLLVAATIQHLEQLKAEGKRFVTVTAETLAALREAPRPPLTRPSAPLAASERYPAASGSAPVSPAKVSTPGKASIPSSAIPVSAEAKAQSMAEIKARALVCVKCPHLAATRKTVVFGVGDIHSPLMFVGEAPGADEDEMGEPFVGKAGQLLTRIIQTMGFSRETVYIANILKCRPDTPGQIAGNRKPTAQEMETCLPYLHAQIDVIQPKVIVALGGTAIEGLLGNIGGITRIRGQWRSYRNTPLMPTFHPAYLLRNQALSEKRKVWEDMLEVMQKLTLPISEKQRNYFLTPERA